ncbi:uncharacterized protein AMSG_09564 [Thecamonas trahens ATCC 50062]|uniref:Rap-GAP domain-containing protein n=1 Tax=Thecamonas trahens ATCC 50062 TaxID=461836 RepID=A0A0L0DNM6_THETB|nr:hypothetical protein AMSG_09564 [Thecamonas trahens ATCC 50062]KNC53922.1 hypothetical protein AMSG_09564 [Thecamonas trahens ATCC 50062]|eukprot:XP_013754126.1 hypothetical protein AMSG_09564 [Thecamonas trahens ATCC 50062]
MATGTSNSSSLYVRKNGFWYEDGDADIAELGASDLGSAARRAAGEHRDGSDGEKSGGGGSGGDILSKLKRRSKRRSRSASASSTGVYALEDPNFDITWYAKYFVGAEHTNYVADADAEYGNVVVSTLRISDAHDPHYRVIVITKYNTDRHLVPNPKNKKLPLKDLLGAVRKGYTRLAKKLKKVSNLAMQKDILKIEDMESIDKYKFGVLLVKPGQTNEADMFGNEHPSPAFTEFLQCLGDEITLAGWDGYRAGLDTKYGNTGETSYYTEIHGCKVMFHVSTCLPFTPGEGAEMTQQLQRKRHIGNDVVVIVFIDADEDSGTAFDTECISSQFNHVWAIVQPTNKASRQTQYKVAVAANEAVKYFMPILPQPPVFTHGANFREWLLTKMINGERSAMHSEAFVKLSERTKELMLGDIVSTYMGARVTNQAKEQALRKQIEAMVSGKASGKPKQSVNIFDAAPVGSSFPGEIRALGFYGESIVYGTDAGLFVRTPGASADAPLSDAGPVHELVVVSDIAVAVAVLGKKRQTYVFSLASATAGLSSSGTLLTAPAMKKATLLAYGTYSTTPLLAVACSSAVFVFQWSGSGFVLTQSHTLPTTVTVLKFFKSFLVIGFGHAFEVIDLETSSISPLRASDDKLSPVAVCVVDAQLMLVFADEGVFVNVKGVTTQDFALKWTTLPTATCFIDPYILSFTRNFVEIRTKVTGRLVQTMQINDCAFHSVHRNAAGSRAAVVTSYDPTSDATSLLLLSLANHTSVGAGLAVLSDSVASIMASVASLPLPAHSALDGLPAAEAPAPSVFAPAPPLPLAPPLAAARKAALGSSAAAGSSGLELADGMTDADAEWVAQLQESLLQASA